MWLIFISLSASQTCDPDQYSSLIIDPDIFKFIKLSRIELTDRFSYKTEILEPMYKLLNPIHYVGRPMPSFYLTRRGDVVIFLLDYCESKIVRVNNIPIRAEYAPQIIIKICLSVFLNKIHLGVI